MSREFDKPARTLDEQIDLLARRGMVVSDRDEAREHLRHISYYRLRAYWLPFEVETSENEHAFRPGTLFDDIVDSYSFDRKLRLMVMDAIERIEVSLRTSWAHRLATQYGPHAYTNSALFRDAETHRECLNSLKSEIGRSHETFVRHYKATYTKPKLPPVWMSCELISFTTLSVWYSNLKDGKDRKAVASNLGLDEHVLISVIHHLAYVRNICAHHSRLWNREATISMALPKRPVELHGLFNTNRPKRIFNTLLVLGYLLDRISPGSEWRKRLVHLVAENPQLDLDAMGFVDDWRARLLEEIGTQ